jgi:hypothetical protein
MRPYNFIKAEKGSNNSTVYYAADGSRTIKSNGTSAWRNNNPGNLRKGKYSRDNSCIGYSGGFAVFPTPERGAIALADLLKNGYKNSSLQSMIKHYAPPKDKNKTAKYLKFILSKLGIEDPKTMIRDLNPKQFDALIKAIENFEGWKEGDTQVEPKPLRITKIMKDKKKLIVAYFAEKLGWVLKAQAIDFAKKRKIDAVVATSRSGNLYLRTRPDLKIENNLDLLG